MKNIKQKILMHFIVLLPKLIGLDIFHNIQIEHFHFQNASETDAIIILQYSCGPFGSKPQSLR